MRQRHCAAGGPTVRQRGPITVKGASMRQRHVSVFADRIVDVLAPAVGHPSAVLVDATLGFGGHTLLLLSRFPRSAGDRDRPGSDRARRGHRPDRGGRTSVTDWSRCTRSTTRSARWWPIVPGAGRRASCSTSASPRCNSTRRERGFAYSVDAPLDMRMDPDEPADRRRRAQHLRRTATSPGCCSEYGEERFARRIAAAVVRERAAEPFATSARLVDLVRRSIPAPARRTGGHPAKRTFQALRIEVNDELGAVRRAVPAALDVLPIGGRIAVLTFHSLEDRIVEARHRRTHHLRHPTRPAGRPSRPRATVPVAGPR